MAESWFSSLSRDSLELFRGISNQPFPELHCAALKVFTVGILLSTSPCVTASSTQSTQSELATECGHNSFFCAAATAGASGGDTYVSSLSAKGIQCCSRLNKLLLDHRVPQFVLSLFPEP